MKYIYTKSKHYKLFCEKNRTDRLYKGIKILPTGDKMNLFKLSQNLSINEEIFDSPIETPYEPIEINNNFTRVDFETKSKTIYRLDIHKVSENGEIINHISFTQKDLKFDRIPDNHIDFERYEDDYNKPTEKYEMIEVMNRIYFILKDMLDKNRIENRFCIGGSEIKSKNKIYEYSLRIIVGDGGFEKVKTDVYPNVGWGLYFSI